MKNSEKKTCYNCAYRGEAMGSAHSKCTFAWRKVGITPPKANQTGVENGWYWFPINYDPVWQEEECQAHSIKVDPDNVTVISPLMEIFGYLNQR